MTLPLYSDGTPWTIFMGEKGIDLTLGQGVIYKGCEVEHWRDIFRGGFQVQAHLHWVNASGEFTEHALDKRRSLGVKKIIRS
jgi:hypothetical protein